MEIFEEVRSISADIFQVPRQNITPDSSAETIKNWDSLHHLNLVLALEERFGLQFDVEELEQMKTIGEIAQLLHGKLGTAA
jgi:acyl carrier protein